MSELLGKVIIEGDIKVLTGMRIGGSSAGLKIGGVDLGVIKDPWGRPYIPGSSLKGKTRSLMERLRARTFDNKGIHRCVTDNDYDACPVCKIWGTLPGNDARIPMLTRLTCCDTFLDERSITEEMRSNLELQLTEVKFETAINRLTGTASGTGSLRQVERVPAGAVFKPLRMIFNVLAEEDFALLKEVFIALELVEHDALGGMGSRGYGRVAFENLQVFWNSRDAYETGDVATTPERAVNDHFVTPQAIVAHFEDLQKRLA